MRHLSLALAIGVPVCLMFAGAAGIAIELKHYDRLDRAVSDDNPNVDITRDERRRIDRADYAKLGLTRGDILGLENPDTPRLPDIPVDPWAPEDSTRNPIYKLAKASLPDGATGLDSVYEADPARVHVTPEPSTVAMMGLGCLGLGLFGNHSRATRRRAL